VASPALGSTRSSRTRPSSARRCSTCCCFARPTAPRAGGGRRARREGWDAVGCSPTSTTAAERQRHSRPSPAGELACIPAGEPFPDPAVLDRLAVAEEAGERTEERAGAGDAYSTVPGGLIIVWVTLRGEDERTVGFAERHDSGFDA